MLPAWIMLMMDTANICNSLLAGIAKETSELFLGIRNETQWNWLGGAKGISSLAQCLPILTCGSTSLEEEIGRRSLFATLKKEELRRKLDP